MNDEYSNYFAEASGTVTRFADTLTGCQFDERLEAIEVFALQALAVDRDHCRAIANLLREGLFAEPIIISRSLFELHFDIQWIVRGDTREEKLERTYRLEATPYFEFAKEVQLIEENFKGPDPSWSPRKVKEFRGMLDKIKKDSPFLLRTDIHTHEQFKKAPALTDRMSAKERLRYYQLYRFLSFFTHPTPSMKQVYLKLVPTEQSVPEMIDEPLKQTLAYTMIFVANICSYCLEIFKSHNPGVAGVRNDCCAILKALIDKTNKGYFRTSSEVVPKS
ncbi:MAG: DUF5677 domain-containing protein [Ignavibacteriales bacterium]|nr:DUF5677 domain-containing protein [Ignavibacteriales bacterium]